MELNYSTKCLVLTQAVLQPPSHWLGSHHWTTHHTATSWGPALHTALGLYASPHACLSWPLWPPLLTCRGRAHGALERGSKIKSLFDYLFDEAIPNTVQVVNELHSIWLISVHLNNVVAVTTEYNYIFLFNCAQKKATCTTKIHKNTKPVTTSIPWKYCLALCPSPTYFQNASNLL